jgi:hypothetical protein
MFLCDWNWGFKLFWRTRTTRNWFLWDLSDLRWFDFSIPGLIGDLRFFGGSRSVTRSCPLSTSFNNGLEVWLASTQVEEFAFDGGDTILST